MGDLLALRESFLRCGTTPGGVRPMVLESWRRSQDYGVHPEIMRPQTADPERLAGVRAANHELFSNAEPLLALLHNHLGEQPHIIALSDRDGYILRLMADPVNAASGASQGANLFEGASWHERDIGCNGAGTALAAGKAVVLIGPEHFQSAYLNWTCIGVPLKSARGEILGALDFSVPNASIRPEVWGLVLSVARKIEASLARPPGEAAQRPELDERNDPLSALSGISELLLSQLNLPPTHARFVEDVRRAVLAEITERRQEEERRCESEQRYRTLFTSINEGFVLKEAVTNAEGDIVDFRFVETNEAFETQTGLRDVAGKTMTEVIPEIEPHWIEAYARVVRTGEPLRFQDRAAALGRWFEVFASKVNGPQSARVAILVSDITERKRAEEKLRESEERFRTMADGLPLIVWVLDADGEQQFANHTFCEFFGVPPEQMRGREWQQIMHPEDAARYSDELFACVRERRPFHGEARVRNTEGEWRDIESWGRPRFSPSGEFLGFVGASADVTERKKAEAALAQAQDEVRRHAAQLEQTVAERTETLRQTVAELEHFSYTIVHDMRAPLRAMQSFGEILREEYHSCLDEKGADYLRRIIESANRMDSLITDSLDYSKAVQTELTLEPLDPGRLLRGMVESYPQFQPPRAEVELSPYFPLVLANMAGLTQCFSNLLGNAIKFVKPGKVPRVRVWAEEYGDRVRLWVQDNGIGIPSDQQERVFVMFQRLSKQYEGTGMGLALVRKVVEKMRGKVGLDSNPGQGTSFWVELERVQPKR
jgi:PAS domain S-box-containing protein